jgi:hypothetical protein
VPEELMKSFGQPQLAMLLPLDGRKKLASADLEKVKRRYDAGILFTDSTAARKFVETTFRQRKIAIPASQSGGSIPPFAFFLHTH